MYAKCDGQHAWSRSTCLVRRSEAERQGRGTAGPHRRSERRWEPDASRPA
ncbi:hypothetical protein STRIP9103_01391 [Streptomyces ipomoeae 91-03]|uniref:Uncharacterized protein n=1 Tax=Streptomyces ipomoeae 91-03 TaxID=698759 RepID=L1KUD7_9ACTN|nr:hypothetical protein STRIP9103_01391 [Streptomyces ipomoeae 91-03]